MQNKNPLHLSEWTDVLLSSFQETNSFGVAVFSKSGQLIYVNSAMNKLCSNFDTTSLIHPTFEKIVSLESKNDLLFSGYLTIGKMNAVNTSIEAKIYQKNDKILIAGGIEVSGLIEQNKTMHVLNQKVTNLQRQLMQEKAELESTMKKLRETQQMLIQSEKMNALGQMVAGVAHEINNPIAFVTNNLYELEKYTKEMFEAFSELESKLTVSGFEKSKEVIDAIKEKYEVDYLTEDISDVLKDSKNGVERVKKIVEDLRKFSRLDESDIKHIDLVDSIKSTLSIVQSEIDKKEIDFTFQSPKTVNIDCYPGQLNQAILNLLLNAIYAVNQKGKIDLIIKEEAKSLLISIADNGTGIPAEIVEKIFNPFFTTKPVGAGTGLGLSITYKIITDLHKGEIDVKSEPGNGSTFTIRIPEIIIN